MIRIRRNMTVCIGALLMTMMLVGMMYGCASAPKTIESLERARAAYSEASSNSDIANNAQVPLYDAKQLLDSAEKAKEIKEIEQKSYLAEKQVQTAVAIAERKKAEAEVERLREERNRILLEHRSLEAKQANIKAEARAKEADQAKKIAIEKAQQLEIKQHEAIEQMKKLELAKQEAQAKALEAEQAQKKAIELKAEIDALQAKQTDRGIVLTLGDVLFATNKANLQPGAMRTVDQLAEFLKKHTERMVAIEGHTDNMGSDTYNLGLSQKRADAVRNALVARGIDQAKIQTIGKGEVYPVASNDTAAGRQQNRRVEIIISNAGEAAQ